MLCKFLPCLPAPTRPRPAWAWAWPGTSSRSRCSTRRRGTSTSLGATGNDRHAPRLIHTLTHPPCPPCIPPTCLPHRHAAWSIHALLALLLPSLLPSPAFPPRHLHALQVQQMVGAKCREPQCICVPVRGIVRGGQGTVKHGECVCVCAACGACAWYGVCVYVTCMWCVVCVVCACTCCVVFCCANVAFAACVMRWQCICGGTMMEPWVVGRWGQVGTVVVLPGLLLQPRGYCRPAPLPTTPSCLTPVGPPPPCPPPRCNTSLSLRRGLCLVLAQMPR